MNQKRKSKLCACGRGRIYTDDNSQYNARDAQGRQVCPECKLDEFYERLRTT